MLRQAPIDTSEEYASSLSSFFSSPPSSSASYQWVYENFTLSTATFPSGTESSVKIRFACYAGTHAVGIAEFCGVDEIQLQLVDTPFMHGTQILSFE